MTVTVWQFLAFSSLGGYIGALGESNGILKGSP